MTAQSASERFASYVAGLRWDDLPAAAVNGAKTWILDTIGVGIAGSSADGMAALHGAAARWGGGETALVWGTTHRAPAASAAFLNATQVHNQEFDCLHEGAVVHAMATLLPAALAQAEQAGGLSGRDLILAVTAGVEVAAGLGLASTAAFRFFRPATAGGFGAVAAAGRLAGLDAAGIANAFGIQYAQTSGTMQPHLEASAVLPMQIGFNARAALQSCDLAATGIAAPRDVFEGRYGYLPLFEGSWDLAPIWQSLGKVWRIAELSHKPYPAGRAAHGGIEGILALREAHGIRADDVQHVRVIAPTLIHRLVGRPDVPAPNASYARLCMAFIGAKALLNGHIDIADCRGDGLTDPATHALASRIEVAIDDNPDANALAPQRVEIALKDGRTLMWSCTEMLAHPRRPLSREQHLAKFRFCLTFAAARLPDGHAERLIKLVDRLEDVDDIRSLMSLLAPG